MSTYKVLTGPVAAIMLYTKISSKEILSIREHMGDTAVWQYRAQTGQLFLSNAACSMLGLDDSVGSDLRQLIVALGCGDRFGVEDFRDALTMGVLSGQTFHIDPRHDAARAIMIRYKPFVSVDRDLERLDGLLIDVTLQSNAMRLMAQRRTCSAQLLDKIGFFEWQTDASGAIRPNQEWLSLTGQPLREQAASWQDMLLPESRSEVGEAVARARADLSNGFYAHYALRTVAGDTAYFISSGALVIDPERRPLGLRGRALRIAKGDARSVPLMTETALAVVSARELRAARAILGWPMQELAAAANVSLSTVRRLEDGGGGTRTGTFQRVVEALQAGGVAFLTGENGQIAVALKNG